MFWKIRVIVVGKPHFPLPNLICSSKFDITFLYKIVYTTNCYSSYFPAVLEVDSANQWYKKTFLFFFCREKADTDANEMSICHSFFNAMKLIILTKHWSTPTTYNLGRNGVQFATLKQHINKLLAIS